MSRARCNRRVGGSRRTEVDLSGAYVLNLCIEPILAGCPFCRRQPAGNIARRWPLATAHHPSRHRCRAITTFLGARWPPRCRGGPSRFLVHSRLQRITTSIPVRISGAGVDHPAAQPVGAGRWRSSAAVSDRSMRSTGDLARRGGTHLLGGLSDQFECECRSPRSRCTEISTSAQPGRLAARPGLERLSHFWDRTQRLPAVGLAVPPHEPSMSAAAYAILRSWRFRSLGDLPQRCYRVNYQAPVARSDPVTTTAGGHFAEDEQRH